MKSQINMCNILLKLMLKEKKELIIYYVLTVDNKTNKIIKEIGFLI